MNNNLIKRPKLNRMNSKGLISASLKAAMAFAVLLCTTELLFAEGSHHLVISEIMAINENTLQDSDGDYSDWIEIYNPGQQAVDLLGWSLSDDPDKPAKWYFPSVKLNAGAYLLVFASNKDRIAASSELHTNFKLSGSGEYLGLYASDRSLAFNYGEFFPAQNKDVSYGLLNDINVYFEVPTPGQANSTAGEVLAPNFSFERGFYHEPFEVALSSAQDNIRFYYTTNGTAPTIKEGTLYTTPIAITTTTPLSVIAVNSKDSTSKVVTHSYLFTEDIRNQSNQPEGYPEVWSTSMYSKSRLPADYEMDPAITKDEAYKDLMEATLMAIPSICIITNKDHIFSLVSNDDTGGIYIYTGKSGDGSMGLNWERPTSIEFIDPQTGKNFQTNCGVKLHGGNSRVPDNSQKHSFRLIFRNEYGASKLHFDIFDDQRNPSNEFNTLVLRAGYNYSWTKNSKAQNVKADFIRDPFTKNSQLDMGQPSAHNRFVHLYINNLYWGVYNLSEKITDDFMSNYMNGNEDEWDVVNDHSGTVDGTRNIWNTMVSKSASNMASNEAYQKFQGNNPDGSPNVSYINYLDVKNFIDYMLLNFYIGNKDWDGNNWLAARNKVTTKHGFRMFVWDAETSMINLNENIVSMDDGEPTKIFNRLKENENFRLLVADRIHKHFFNGGALSPEATAERYRALANEIDLAIIGESARWGDYRRDVDNIGDGAQLYTRNDHWLPEVENQLANYLPKRTDIVFKQLKAIGLYPSVNAPLFSQYSGKITEDLDFSMENPNTTGDIYYTSDDSDPRNTNDEISATAQLYTGNLTISGKISIKARVKTSTKWSALSEASFKGDDNGQVSSPYVELAQISANCSPNPVNTHTTISYYLPQKGATNVAIYSVDGQLLEMLYSGEQSEGTHHVQWTPKGLTNGVYFTRIEFKGYQKTEKLLLMQ
ncbi:MAG: FN3 associated domain-containing protein [Prolixibacteraceae bacterium]